MTKPLAIDLFCGLGGWAEGFLAEGYDVIGFDIERHDYGTGGYPGQLVLGDVQQLSGKQFRHAAVIVASPPCQTYSYMAMPWSRAKELARQHREDVTLQLHLNCLFNSCFRIAAEAGVPLVVENVKGAQPWVGPARAHFGSFYFWGDINSVGNRIVAGRLKFGESLNAPTRSGGKMNPDGTEHPQVSWFKIADSKHRGSKNGGGSWFAVANNTISGHKQNPDGRKVPMNFHEHVKTGKPDRSFQSVAVESSGLKRMSGLRGMSHPTDAHPRDLGGPNDPRRFSSKSSARKAASAAIAKIPFPLSSYIARVFRPTPTDSASHPASRPHERGNGPAIGRPMEDGGCA